MGVRLIVHAGMGKTGTTTLQRALGTSGPALTAQKARYLGMWFQRLGEAYGGFAGLLALSRTDAQTQRTLADRFADGLVQEAAQQDLTTFVLSNESIFERAEVLRPFFLRLSERLELRVLVYLRPPRAWLPSAFAQWGLLHKTQPGPIPSFAALAPMLVKTYDAVTVWHAALAPSLIVRAYGEETDIVADFAAATGVTPNAQTIRHQTRAEPVELVLRGLYNDRFATPVMPAHFNGSVLKTARHPVPSVARMAALAADRTDLEAIVAARRETFAFIEETFGIAMLDPPAWTEADPAAGAADPQESAGAGDPQAAAGAVDPQANAGAAGPAAGAGAAGPAPGSTGAPPPADDPAFQARLIDYLVELTLAQSIRITRLERAVEALSGSADADGAATSTPAAAPAAGKAG